MLSHVILGISDVERAVEFYDAVLGILGYQRRWLAETGAGYGTHDELGIDTLWLTKPIDGRPATVGNGTNVAFVAPSRVIGNSACVSDRRPSKRRCVGTPARAPRQGESSVKYLDLSRVEVHEASREAVLRVSDDRAREYRVEGAVKEREPHPQLRVDREFCGGVLD